MTPVTSGAGLDLDELVQLIAGEVEAGRMAARRHGGVDGFEISTITVRLGRIDGEWERDGDATEQPILLTDRYPPARDGWQLEVELRDAGPRARARDGDWGAVVEQHAITLLDVFGEQPVGALRRASSELVGRLDRIGVSTIDELTRASARDLASLVATGRPVQLRELQFEARLLDNPIPRIPASVWDERPLAELIGASATELRELLGETRVSRLICDQLEVVLAVLLMTVRRAVLEQVTLADIRAPAGRTG